MTFETIGSEELTTACGGVDWGYAKANGERWASTWPALRAIPYGLGFALGVWDTLGMEPIPQRPAPANPAGR